MDFRLGLRKLNNLPGKFKKQLNKEFINKNKYFKFKIIKLTKNNPIKAIANKSNYK